jgi:hypothetical protein
MMLALINEQSKQYCRDRIFMQCRIAICPFSNETNYPGAEQWTVKPRV